MDTLRSLPLQRVSCTLFFATVLVFSGCTPRESGPTKEQGGKPVLVSDAYFNDFEPVRSVGLPASFDTLNIFSGHGLTIEQMITAPNGILYVWEDNGLTLEAHSFKGDYLRSITFSPDEPSRGGIPNHIRDVAAFADGRLAVLVTSNVYWVDEQMTLLDSLDNWIASQITPVDSVGVCTLTDVEIRCLNDQRETYKQMPVTGTRGPFNWDLFLASYPLSGQSIVITYLFYPYLEIADLAKGTSTLVDLPVDREMPTLPERREYTHAERAMPEVGFPRPRTFSVLGTGIDPDHRIHLVINDPGERAGSSVIVMTLSGTHLGTYSLPFPVTLFTITSKGTLLIQREGSTKVHHLLPKSS